jgi:predicted GNAT family N-acyltransferase
VLAIRSEVLREGKLAPAECRFPSDDLQGAFHLGFYRDETLACAASFHPQKQEAFDGTGYQLRGMATLENYRGMGLGNLVVNFALVYLRGQKVNYLWCNARKKAVQFYKSTGFEIISGEFDIPGIGPHFTMYVKIQ